MVIQKDKLNDLVRNVLLAAGADEETADCVADHLVSSNLCGVDTHGVWHLAPYVNEVKSGTIVPTVRPEILKETPTSALVTGNWTFGHVTAKFGMEVAIEKAKENDMAVVGLVRCNHIGRLGHYVEMAAENGMISMVWAGGLSEIAPVAFPYGGRMRVLNTNPVAMGFPAGEEGSMFFDFATTALSGVKVENAKRRKEKLPPGCIADKNGVPTIDPNDYFEGGGHLSFGGHKGYALMMAVEFLGRIFTGSDAFAESGRGNKIMRHQGVTMFVFRADIFHPISEYQSLAGELKRRVKAVPPAPGFEAVLVPGDPEARTREIRQREGIPIADDIWKSITEAADSLGVAMTT